MSYRTVLAALLGVALLAACRLELPPSLATGPARLPHPTVDLGSGQSVEGVDSGVDAQAFLGMPYARPPVGDLRFRPTVTPEAPWNGTRSATALGSPCIQMKQDYTSGTTQIVGSEDCLYLNVFRPRIRKPSLPVMVWIHGGAFVSGSGGEPIYEASKLAAKAGVLVVTFNYRLGRLGFLSHPALSARQESPSGNYALHDMIAALGWVKRNIARFGGDPAQVTLFGESAGGRAVQLLATSPLAKDLFQRAISQSAPHPQVQTISQAEADGVSLAGKLGCSEGTPSAIADCLVSKVSAETYAKNSLPGGSPKPFILEQAQNPVADGIVLNGDPVSEASRGHVNGNAFIIGHNAGDGIVTMFGSGGDTMQFSYTAQQFEAGLVDSFGAKIGETLYAMYAPSRYGNVADAILDFRSDFDFGCHQRQMLRAIAQGSSARVYRYLFNGQLLGALQYLAHGKPPKLGSVTLPFTLPYPAFHGVDVPYVFQNLDLVYQKISSRAGFPIPVVPRDRVLERLMLDYWGSFARNGDPNSPSALPWPRFDTLGDEAFVTLKAVPTLGAHYRAAACDIYDQIYPVASGE